MKNVAKYVAPLAASIVVVAVPTALALGKPVAGGWYQYEKVLPKDPGWHSPRPKTNVVNVVVSPDGKSVEPGYGFWISASNGCRGRSSGRPLSAPTGGQFPKTPLKPNGTFRAIDTRPHQARTRYYRAEMYGEFSADGSYVRVRLRFRLYVTPNPSTWVRCDGRWLSFRAPLRKRSP